jgi:uncharacterized membrane protein (DUF4010 family)
MPDQGVLELFRSFAIALSIGALIGLEREKKKEGEKGFATGGLRTFILYALAGALGALLSEELDSPWPLAATLIAVAAAVVAGYVLHARSTAGQLGLTTELAAITTSLLGAVAVLGQEEIAVATAVAMSALLWMKAPLHGAVAKLDSQDIYAGLKLLFATFIVLPLLPDETIDPWGAWNPYKLWLLVVLISSLSLVGYVAVRALGDARGMVLTGIAGGLVSSTAVTLAFSRQSQEAPQSAPALASGILLAWAIMCVRVLVEIGIVHPPLLASAAIPIGAMGVVATGFALFKLWQQAKDRARSPEVRLRTPFSLMAAIRFAGLFATVLLVVKLALKYLPGGAVHVVAAVAGTTDVDAITLSMAGHAQSTGELETAVIAITIATVANTLVKTGMTVGLGSAPLRRQMLVAGPAISAAGIAALLLI